MKNIAVIFAGGTGRRMQAVSKPKQFLELHGKPVIIYTLELFDNHPQIDGIAIACLKDWIPYLQKQLDKFGIKKVGIIVEGGESGQQSIYNALTGVRDTYGDNCNVLIHDGVRPLISEEVISQNIMDVNNHGNCITCAPATETSLIKNSDGSFYITSRSDSLIARAPQTFRLMDILGAHDRLRHENRVNGFIDSASLMNHFGYKLHTIIGPVENIKITTPSDFFVFRAMIEVHENKQIFGF